MGWKFIPLDVGLQAPCADRTKHPMSRDLTKAQKQGQVGRQGGPAQRREAGICLLGSALYSDIESFSSTDVGCADAVRSYLTGWTPHFITAVTSPGSTATCSPRCGDSPTATSDARFARPDVVWSAQWDRRTALTGWSDVPDHHWPAGQRIKQYIGDHDESYGGYRVNIDSNAIDAPVATVAHRFALTGSAPVPVHEGPSYRGGEEHPSPGDLVDVVCQIGTPAGKWNKLHNGSYVPDAAVAGGAPKPTVPPCAVPFQVRSDASARSAPDLAPSTPSRPCCPTGALAWIQCETPGMTLGRPGYWASLAGGGWVSGARPRPAQALRALARRALVRTGHAAGDPDPDAHPDAGHSQS